jgi:hypothetical protein
MEFVGPLVAVEARLLDHAYDFAILVGVLGAVDGVGGWGGVGVSLSRRQAMFQLLFLLMLRH